MLSPLRIFLRIFRKREKRRGRELIVLTAKDVEQMLIRRTYLLIDDAGVSKESLEKGLMDLFVFLFAKDAVLVIDASPVRKEMIACA